MRTTGYISPRQAARRLHINPKTAAAWAKLSLAGIESNFVGVVQTVSRRILIPLANVERLMQRSKSCQ